MKNPPHGNPCGQILVHGAGHVLGVAHRLHHGAGAAYHVAAAKDARAAGAALLVRGQQAPVGHGQAGGGVHDLVLGALAGGDHHAVRPEQLRLAQPGYLVVFVKGGLLVDHALVGDLHRAGAVVHLHPVGHRVFQLPHAGGGLVAAAEHMHLPHPLADGGAGHVHGRIARPDHYQAAAQIVHVRVDQIVDGKVHVAQALAGDAQLFGPPYAGADKDGLVAVPLQVVHRQRPADHRVGPDLDAQLHQLGLVPVQHALGQTEFRDAVPQHTADLVPAFKQGHVVALLGQQHRDGDARRAGADDGHPLALGGLPLQLQPVQMGVGDVVFNAGNVHRRALAAQYTVSLALLFVVAYQRANHTQRVVFKQHLARLFGAVFQKHPDHVRDRGIDGAALAALGNLAVQTAPGFVHHMDGHAHSLLTVKIKRTARPSAL